MANAGIAFDNFEDKETGEKISLAEIMNLPGIVAQAGVTLADYDALKATDARSTVLVGGRTTRGDIGAGVFSFIEGDQSASVSGDTGEGIWVAPASDTSGASGAWRRDIGNEIDSRWYAFGSDVEENAAIAKQACDHSSYFRVPVVFHNELVSSFTVDTAANITGNLKAGPSLPALYGRNLLTTTAVGVRFNLTVDCNGNSIGGVLVSGDDARGFVAVNNITGGLKETYGLQNAIELAGASPRMSTAGKNHTHDPAEPNDSIPRAIATTGIDCRLLHQDYVDVNCAWIVNANHGVGLSFSAKGLRDNAIYALAGASFGCSVAYCRFDTCPDETIVVSHGGYMSVGRIESIDSGIVAVQGSTLYIDDYYIRRGTLRKNILKARALQEGDPAYGKISIGRLHGDVPITTDAEGPLLWDLTPDYKVDLSIDSIDLKVRMSSGHNAILGSHKSGKFQIGDVVLDLDGADAKMDKTVYIDAPQNLTGPSSVGNIQVVNNSTSKSLRFRNFVKDFIRLPVGLYMTVNVGPYIEFGGGLPTAAPILFSNQAPTAGSWPRGTVVFDRYASAGGKAGWEYTATGWKPFGAIDA